MGKIETSRRVLRKREEKLKRIRSKVDAQAKEMKEKEEKFEKEQKRTMNKFKMRMEREEKARRKKLKEKRVALGIESQVVQFGSTGDDISELCDRSEHSWTGSLYFSEDGLKSGSVCQESVDEEYPALPKWDTYSENSPVKYKARPRRGSASSLKRRNRKDKPVRSSNLRSISEL